MDYFPLSYLPELYGHGFTNQLLRLSHRLVATGGKALANFIVGKFESMMIEFGAKFVFCGGREIDRDQVVDYAGRLGIDAAEAEKNLAASPGYL